MHTIECIPWLGHFAVASLLRRKCVVTRLDIQSQAIRRSPQNVEVPMKVHHECSLLKCAVVSASLQHKQASLAQAGKARHLVLGH